MKLGFTLFVAVNNLRKRKLRGILTIGGMALGVALVIFLVSIGFGLQRLIVSKIADVEALSVLDVSKGESTLLELNDEIINQFGDFEHVENVSPSLSLSGQIIKNESVTDVAVYGIKPDALSIEGVKIHKGEEFSGNDAAEIYITSTALGLIGITENQEVLNSRLVLKVLVPEIIEGTEEEELIAKEVTMVVKGILNDDEELSIVYTPLKFLESLGFKADYSEAKVKVEGDKEYNTAKIKVTDESKLPSVRAKIEEMGYQVDSIADTVGAIDRIFLIFELVVAGFGAIALFVAAMGSLNTLTVSLLERTREIGLMKALGATSGDIYRMFMVEAIVIGMTGGILGVGIGIGAGELVNTGLNFLAQRAGGQPVDIFFTPLIFTIIVLAVIFGVSLVTGLYPARRAGKINALDALRYE